MTIENRMSQPCSVKSDPARFSSVWPIPSSGLAVEEAEEEKEEEEQRTKGEEGGQVQSRP
jgi:hypothetical protein